MSHPITALLTIVLPHADTSLLDKAQSVIRNVDGAYIQSEGKAVTLAMISSMESDAKSYFSALQSDVKDLLSTYEIKADICVSGNENRRKSLLICDMDSTLIGQECINELADFAGVKDHVSEITERAMRGEIGFDGALRERVGLLKGLPLSVLQTCFDERITLNSGARTLAMTMAAHGAKTVIVSGGFTFFSERVAKAAGFEMHQANVLLDDGTHLTGMVQDPILGREAKKEALMAHSESVGGPEMAVAIGDGANDLAMITAAGLGIAYDAKPAVAAAAHCAIDHTDLTTALYFQGYQDAEFVTS